MRGAVLTEDGEASSAAAVPRDGPDDAARGTEQGQPPRPQPQPMARSTGPRLVSTAALLASDARFPLARPTTAPRLGPGYRSVLSAAAYAGGADSGVAAAVPQQRGAFGKCTKRTTFVDDAAAACLRPREQRSPRLAKTPAQIASETMRAVEVDHALRISEAGRTQARKERQLANAYLCVRRIGELPFGIGELFSLGQLEDRKNAKLDSRGGGAAGKRNPFAKPDPAADFRNFASAVVGEPIRKYHRPTANLGPESDDD